MHNSIEAKGLTVQFGTVTALDQVDISFGENRIYGLLGRNGAGKSTLLNVMGNRLYPTQGSVSIDGEPGAENDKAQGKIYYMGEKNVCPDGTTVRQLFRWSRDFYPAFDMEYANQLAAQFGLNTKKKLKGLSTGYLTIAKLIAALASNASYVFFDEPVLGLDANHREMFYRELIHRYSERPSTIIISTHLIEEIADIVEQVVIIKEGKILLDRPAEEVKRMGYMVSGKASEVDAFCAGKQILGEDQLGGLKSVCLLGEPENVPATLEIAALDLQKLFVQLTNA
ncbi:MAG: ABC transporter ATP-binding protein [Oscillospiraceae bacterium]|nr:ABC transporter ATP-binding protein [Oscillospiraceae bacterium]